MFARMGDVALDVLEIKLLSQINGEITPKGLVPVLGLPLFDVCQMLVRLAREGIISCPGGNEQFDRQRLSVAESMQEAFAALDANDDEQAPGDGNDDEAEPAPKENGVARGSRAAASSALDKLFSGGGDAAPRPVDKKADGKGDGDFLSILRRPRKK